MPATLEEILKPTRNEQIEALLNQGLTQREVATKLGISRSSVANHVVRLKKKGLGQELERLIQVQERRDADPSLDLCWKIHQEQMPLLLMTLYYRGQLDDSPAAKLCMDHFKSVKGEIESRTSKQVAITSKQAGLRKRWLSGKGTDQEPQDNTTSSVAAPNNDAPSVK